MKYASDSNLDCYTFLLVRHQTILDILCSYFDLTVNFGAMVSPSILEPALQALESIKTELQWCLSSDKQELTQPLLSTFKLTALKVKTIMVTHEPILAMHPKYSQVILLCESLLFQIGDVCCSGSHATFTPQTLKLLEDQFNMLLARVVEVEGNDEAYVVEDYEDELTFELERIAKG